MTHRAGVQGPVVAGILAEQSAEDVLRVAFPEAQGRDVPLRVVVAGAAASFAATGVPETIERWGEKYPGVECTVAVRAGLDAAVTLVAGARGSALMVVGKPVNRRDAAVLQAVRHRLSCPLRVLGEEVTVATRTS
ncbi:hypothetical protein AB0J83_18465 [Actinoplanes sp. NPDC049596]|uniref:hypothetical protein n=1 Tax=unclassified Actinoplanes TaxID=2626549 RepID=UPI0034466A99